MLELDLCVVFLVTGAGHMRRLMCWRPFFDAKMEVLARKVTSVAL